MPGSLATWSPSALPVADRDALLDAINLADSFELDTVADKQYLLSVARRPGGRQYGESKFEDDRWVVLCSGDIVSAGPSTLADVADVLDSGEHELFASLDGAFSFIALHKPSGTLYAVSDRRCQRPIFFSVDSALTCIATDLSVFCRLPGGARFNRDWLWQHLFFNFPIAENSFLRGVERMPPATVLQIDPANASFRASTYASLYSEAGTAAGG